MGRFRAMIIADFALCVKGPSRQCAARPPTQAVGGAYGVFAVPGDAAGRSHCTARCGEDAKDPGLSLALMFGENVEIGLALDDDEVNGRQRDLAPLAVFSRERQAKPRQGPSPNS